MGFFSNLFKKPKSLEEQVKEVQPTSWYENKVSNILIEIFLRYDEDGQEAAVNLLFLRYFESLENISRLNAEGVKIDVLMMSKEMLYFYKKIYEEQTDAAHKAFCVSQAFKERHNAYVRFAKKLNHNFYGQTAFFISELIFLGYIDVDKDEWLYDKALFAFNAAADDDNGTGLFEKISSVLSEKNLLTEKIVAEIRSEMDE